MPITIPQANGVPGIGGPPDWFSAPPTGSPRLDDVRWTGSAQRTFGAGAGQNAMQRAVQGTVGGQQYAFLSFRAGFVPSLSDQWDAIFIGLQRVGGTEAMVLRIQPHDAFFTPAGPPSANPPAAIIDVDAWTRASGATSWTSLGTPPTWVAPAARSWLQSAATAPPTDPNNRWAMQVRVPVKSSGGIADNDAVNLGNSFLMWYLILATTTSGGFDQPVIIADYRAVGTTTYADILLNNFPPPTEWDSFDLASGPATNGGVTIQWGDVQVSNVYGTGIQIANGQSNTFIARPRNYRPDPIATADVNATFRIANWGSVAGNPDQPDFTSGVWDYIPGNSELVPVPSVVDIAALPAGTNPPATSPIPLTATMTLPSGASLHQCILVTLSGTSLTFLSNSVFQNMHYDHTSTVEREADISVVGLEKTPNGERDVMIAIEKLNMPASIPGGVDEGRFLDASMARLIEEGGELAEKLLLAQKLLSQLKGDYGSMERLKELINLLYKALAKEWNNDYLRYFIDDLARWLPRAKQNQSSAHQLALACDLLGQLLATGYGWHLTPDTLYKHLYDWLWNLSYNAAVQAARPAQALADWLFTLKEGNEWGEVMAALAIYLETDWRDLDERDRYLRSILEIIHKYISILAKMKPGEARQAIAAFVSGLGLWLRGDERRQILINILSEAGLTTEDLDQLFPTMRVHVYHDTGQRIKDNAGVEQIIWREQSSFGSYAQHEGLLEGWQTSIEGAEQLDEAGERFMVRVNDDSRVRIAIRIEALEPKRGQEGERDERFPGGAPGGKDDGKRLGGKALADEVKSGKDKDKGKGKDKSKDKAKDKDKGKDKDKKRKK